MKKTIILYYLDFTFQCLDIKQRRRMQVSAQVTVRNQKWQLHVSVCAIAKMLMLVPAKLNQNLLWLVLSVKVLLITLQPRFQKEVSNIH